MVRLGRNSIPKGRFLGKHLGRVHKGKRPGLAYQASVLAQISAVALYLKLC